VFFLRDRHGAARAVKHDETRARRALIDCSDVVCHFAPPKLLVTCGGIAHALFAFQSAADCPLRDDACRPRDKPAVSIK